MSKKYDILVFIGRFQPFHFGHKRVIDRALTLSDEVLVLVGSSNVSRSIRNPFTFEERKQMIQRSLFSNDLIETDEKINELCARIIIRPLDDIMYNDDQWITQVQQYANTEILGNLKGNSYNHYNRGLKDAKIGLIGCNKDHTSYYLKLFPTWEDESVEFLDPINSTDIRDSFFNWKMKDFMQQNNDIPTSVKDFLFDFSLKKEFHELKSEHEFVQHYQRNIQKYPRIEQTVDSVVVQSGHVLLVRRRAAPGTGKWALPGGFIKLTETLEEAALRELKEETKIKVPVPVLKGSIVTSKTYDNPNRSDRTRIITQAFLIKLPNHTELPKVKGSDDADKAVWVPLGELQADEMFEDHFHIIQDLIGEL